MLKVQKVKKSIQGKVSLSSSYLLPSPKGMKCYSSFFILPEMFFLSIYPSIQPFTAVYKFFINFILYKILYKFFFTLFYALFLSKIVSSRIYHNRIQRASSFYLNGYTGILEYVETSFYGPILSAHKFIKYALCLTSPPDFK